MQITNPKDAREKKLIVFDLDGTLTKTKSPLDSEMSELISLLLGQKKVAVIGGGSYAQFQKQFLGNLKASRELLSNLFLFPVTANAFYHFQNEWEEVYNFKFGDGDAQKIRQAFEEVLRAINYVPPEKTYGEIIENRGAQITFSALGQDVVAMLGDEGVRLKEEWKKKNDPLKLKIARLVQERLPEFEVHAAAFTSIDVTKKGIDKAYGLHQIEKSLDIKIEDMVFIGDALFPGGNDHAVIRTGVDYIPVEGPEETKKVIQDLLTP